MVSLRTTSIFWSIMVGGRSGTRSALLHPLPLDLALPTLVSLLMTSAFSVNFISLLFAFVVDVSPPTGLRCVHLFFPFHRKNWCQFDFEKQHKYPRPGPIDNKSLLQPGEDVVRRGVSPFLTPVFIVSGLNSHAGLSENFDYVILTEAAWKFLHSSHGGGPEIRRKCIRQVYSKQNIVEIRPMMVKVIPLLSIIHSHPRR